MVRLTINLAIQWLCAIKKHIADSAKTFLKRLDHLCLLACNALAVEFEAAPGYQRDHRIADAKTASSAECGNGINRHHHGQHGHQQDERTDQHQHGLQHAESNTIDLLRDTGDHFAAVAGEVNLVGLIKGTPIKLDAEV